MGQAPARPFFFGNRNSATSGLNPLSLPKATAADVAPMQGLPYVPAGQLTPSGVIPLWIALLHK